MAVTNSETRTREGTCPTHGQVTAHKQVPKLKFPIVVTGIARGAAAIRPYRCPDCGAKVTSSPREAKE
jgi:hypothetical protein